MSAKPALAVADNFEINGLSTDLGAEVSNVTWIADGVTVQNISMSRAMFTKLVETSHADKLLNSSSCAPANAAASAIEFSRCCAISRPEMFAAIGSNASSPTKRAMAKTVICPESFLVRNFD